MSRWKLDPNPIFGHIFYIIKSAKVSSKLRIGPAALLLLHSDDTQQGKGKGARATPSLTQLPPGRDALDVVGVAAIEIGPNGALDGRSIANAR